MASTKKKADTDETEVSFETVVKKASASSTSQPKPVPPKPRPKIKRITFHQYAVLRDIPERHRSGLMAFVKFPQKKRSIEEWDSCFKDY